MSTTLSSAAAVIFSVIGARSQTYYTLRGREQRKQQSRYTQSFMNVCLIVVPSSMLPQLIQAKGTNTTFQTATRQQNSGVFTTNITLYKQLFDNLNPQRFPSVGTDTVQIACAWLGYDVSQYQIKSIMDLCFNSKDKLSQQDFVQFMYIIENSDPDDIQKVLFCAADLNFNGTMEQDELAYILKAIGYDQFSEKHVAQLFNETKDNEDDSMSFEMFNEVMNAIKEKFGPPKQLWGAQKALDEQMKSLTKQAQ